jgi:hypothetical protein
LDIEFESRLDKREISRTQSHRDFAMEDRRNSQGTESPSMR